MGMTFKYNIYKRWFPILTAPVFLLLTYVFIRAAYQMNTMIYGLLYLSISISIAAFWFYILTKCRTEIIVNQKGIKIFKPLRTIEIEWEDLGRDRILAGYRRMWQYYIRCVNNKKKIVLFKEDINNSKMLDDFINSKCPAGLK